MKTSRLLAAFLLSASPALAKAAVSHTVSDLDGAGATFIVGNVFDSWYEARYRGGAGAGNVSNAVNESSGSSETYAPADTLPDHDSVYTARNGSMTAGKAVVANGAADGSRSGFGGLGEGGGASGQSSGPAAKPDSKTSGDTTPAKGLKPLKADTFLTSFPGTLQLQPGTGQETPAGGALENPVDWRWASLQGDDKSTWKFADGAGGASAAGEEEPEGLAKDNADSRRNLNLNLKNQPPVRRFAVVSAPEPAGALTMAGFLGLALFSRRRSAARL